MLKLQQTIDRSRAARPKELAATPILVYGAGNKGKQVATFLRQHGHEVLGLADAAAGAADSWQDLPIRRLVDWQQRLAASETTLVVAIHNCHVDMAPLLARLRQSGIGRVINPVEFQAIFEGQLPGAYWLAGPQAYSAHGESLIRLEGLLADDSSRDLLRRVVEFRLTGNYAALPQPTPADQYSPLDLPRWPSPLRFVDGGAFDGDTLRQFRQRGYEFERLAAFEPDPRNFSRLCRCIEELGGGICLPCGLARTSCQVRFASSGTGASHIAHDGDQIIQCVSLDESFPGFAPTLIKLDIEGAEIDALRGAEKTIAADRPGLAISVYHDPAHLWQIPLMIDEWRLGYRFNLRMHGYSSFDLVLYATPHGA